MEADFLVFYRIFDICEEERLTGPRFIRLATQLPRYDGAVRRRIEYEANLQQSAGADYEIDERFNSGESMSMSEALARSAGDDMAVLNSLNNDSKNSALGSLFEYETG